MVLHTLISSDRITEKPNKTNLGAEAVPPTYPRVLPELPSPRASTSSRPIRPTSLSAGVPNFGVRRPRPCYHCRPQWPYINRRPPPLPIRQKSYPSGEYHPRSSQTKHRPGLFILSHVPFLFWSFISNLFIRGANTVHSRCIRANWDFISNALFCYKSYCIVHM